MALFKRIMTSSTSVTFIVEVIKQHSRVTRREYNPAPDLRIKLIVMNSLRWTDFVVKKKDGSKI